MFSGFGKRKSAFLDVQDTNVNTQNTVRWYVTLKISKLTILRIIRLVVPQFRLAHMQETA
jgi:hypothetical protein